MTDAIYQRLTAGWPYYHQPQPPQEAPVSLLAAVETEIHHLAAKAKQLEEEVLPSVTADAQKAEALLASPAAEALLAALHVPADAILNAVVPVINWLASAYEKPTEPEPAGGEPVAG
jgi:hypothetical protein